MDMCSLCFDPMDMIGFSDQREQTSTCVKLECGHAYHTRCIIQCLSRVDRKCPQCNTHKDPHQQLEHNAILKKLVSEIKQDKRLRESVSELNEAKQECKDAITQLKKDIKAYAKIRAVELELATKRKYMLDCVSEVRRVACSIA